MWATQRYSAERQGVPRGIVPGKKEFRNWVVLAVMFPNCRGWESLLLWCMTLNLSGGSGKSVRWLTILYM